MRPTNDNAPAEAGALSSTATDIGAALSAKGLFGALAGIRHETLLADIRLS